MYTKGTAMLVENRERVICCRQDFSLHWHGSVVVLVCSRGLVLAPSRSVVELSHCAQGFPQVLWVSCLQLFVGNVVGVGELWEVATHLRVPDLQRGRVGLQVLWGEITTNWLQCRIKNVNEKIEEKGVSVSVSILTAWIEGSWFHRDVSSHPNDFIISDYKLGQTH